MKYFKKNLKSVSLLLSFVVLFSSCNQFDDSSDATDFNAISYTGKQLFKSIYFGSGEFADDIHQLERLTALSVNLPDEQKIEFEAKIEELVLAIDQTDATFFSEFKKNISSGNHQLIQQSMNSGALVLESNIEIIFPKLKKVIAQIKDDVRTGELTFEKNGSVVDYQEKLTQAFNKKEYDSLLSENMISSKEQAACSWAIACVVYFAIAAHNTVAVTALIYFKVAFWGPGIEKSTVNGNITDDSDSLNTEILIDEIAEYYEGQNDN